MVRELPIRIGDVAAAMEDHGGELAWYLDTTSGEVVPVSEELFLHLEDEPEEVEGWFDEVEIAIAREIEAESGRYEPIPHIPSYRMYELMVAFANGVEDDELRDRLAIALDGRGAFGRFKRVLADYDEEARQRWFRVHDEYLAARVREWLRGLGIEPVPRG